MCFYYYSGSEGPRLFNKRQGSLLKSREYDHQQVKDTEKKKKKKKDVWAFEFLNSNHHSLAGFGEDHLLS